MFGFIPCRGLLHKSVALIVHMSYGKRSPPLVAIYDDRSHAKLNQKLIRGITGMFYSNLVSGSLKEDILL